jgi:hypothetical protein
MLPSCCLCHNKPLHPPYQQRPPTQQFPIQLTEDNCVQPSI